MKYYENGQIIEDSAPSCRNTSMKVLAENVGIHCGYVGDNMVLFDRDKVVLFLGVNGIVNFINLHFWVWI